MPSSTTVVTPSAPRHRRRRLIALGVIVLALVVVGYLLFAHLVTKSDYQLASQRITALNQCFTKNDQLMGDQDNATSPITTAKIGQQITSGWQQCLQQSDQLANLKAVKYNATLAKSYQAYRAELTKFTPHMNALVEEMEYLLPSINEMADLKTSVDFAKLQAAYAAAIPHLHDPANLQFAKREMEDISAMSAGVTSQSNAIFGSGRQMAIADGDDFLNNNNAPTSADFKAFDASLSNLINTAKHLAA